MSDKTLQNIDDGDEPQFVTTKFTYTYKNPANKEDQHKVWVEADVLVVNGFPEQNGITLYLFEINNFDLPLNRKVNTWLTDSVMDAIAMMALNKTYLTCSQYPEYDT